MSDLVIRTEADNYQPVMSVEQAIERRQMIARYTAAVMVDGEDYGQIPGTNTKKVLLKPGAEKLVRIFGLTPRFTDVKIEEDWTGEQHGGEMFFAYTIKCSLYRNEVFMGDADGSCNSWEKKYRYVKKQRVCPSCGQQTIFPQKDKPGFFCWKNKGGCGRQFTDNTAEYVLLSKQDAGQTADPDIADKVNTIRKMAEKRALVAACLIVVGASEFFTQDIEPERREPQMSAADNMQHRTPPARPAASQRQEEAYEAEWRPANIDEDGVVHEQHKPVPPVPTITKAEASKRLKAVLDALGYCPPSADHYKAIMRHIFPDLKPEEWTAYHFQNAADLPADMLNEAIGKMRDYVPEAAGKANDALVDAATMYQSPAAAIKESLNSKEAQSVA